MKQINRDLLLPIWILIKIIIKILNKQNGSQTSTVISTTDSNHLEVELIDNKTWDEILKKIFKDENKNKLTIKEVNKALRKDLKKTS